jgi:chromosome segregation ATPase
MISHDKCAAFEAEIEKLKAINEMLVEQFEQVCEENERWQELYQELEHKFKLLKDLL